MKVVLKIGGSLMEQADTLLNEVASHFNDRESKVKVVVVPGGGAFANVIREASRTYSLSEEASHWMAISAMEQYAYLLNDRTDIPLIDDTEQIPDGFSILLPYRLLKENDELEHSWDVTSDTIAAWITKRIGAMLVKATDVDGVLNGDELIEEIPARELESMGETCTDRILPKILADYRMDCTIINGTYPGRVVAAIERKAVKGTYIKGNI
ncbi:delta 1-pyrroline-5-carboxylate synthetase [Methanococcoides methylutens MM1]|uniref:Delta 1-pyrroline-5-carboxylate synthetase n=2 Tax=Methanococcoides methylutens TaxID=2226 RepID=A0A0E3STB6_METMT|nr:delta 1-pyrroline-5-carboxylate synthetase [Methanococcoides methylutens MM1]